MGRTAASGVAFESEQERLDSFDLPPEFRSDSRVRNLVLDHPELPWLGTEQEKIACFEQLGIERDLLPHRIYAGHAKGLINCFPLKTPVAVGPEAAVFVYIDPGMGTRTEPDSWGEAHRRLWEKLRQSGRRVEVVAVAWEQRLLDRAGRRLQSWAARDISEAEKEILSLREAIADADWDTVARHGGLDATMRKFHQWEQENPASNGRGMIDDFRLRGSRTWRRMGDTATKGGGAGRWCTILTITNLHYQRAKPSPLWSRLCPETRIVRGLARIPRILRGKGPCGAGIVRPRPDGTSWRRTGGGGSGGSAPGFFAAGAAPGRGRWCARMVTPSPLPFGVAPSTVIPGAKAIERCRG